MSGGPVRSAIDIFAPKAGKYIDQFEGKLKGDALKGFFEGGPSGAASAITSRLTDSAKDFAARGLKVGLKAATSLGKKGAKQVKKHSEKAIREIKNFGESCRRVYRTIKLG